MTVRTLFIGMDGATFTVLNDLTSRSGRRAGDALPGKIFEEGTRAKLRLDAQSADTARLGVADDRPRPGASRRVRFIRAEERGEDVYITLYDSRDCRVETIWSIASRQGLKVAALNFPFTAPPPNDLNGFMVPGFIPWRHLRRSSAPADSTTG